MGLEERLTSTKRVYDGRIINLRVDTVKLPDGNIGQREIVEHHGAVAIVPVLPNGDIVMVRQYRHAAGECLLEIPAGTRDRDESIEVCAARELAEEVKYSAARLIKLFASFMAPGYTTELIHMFAAFDLSPMAGSTDADEFLEIEHVPIMDALDMVKNGQIKDSKSISAILYVQAQWAKLNV